MEEMILEELSHFKQYIESKKGEPLDFYNKFNLPILNALWKVTAGERFDYDNPRLIDIVARVIETVRILGNPKQFLLYAFPWIAEIFPSFARLDYAFKTISSIVSLAEEKIKQHKESLDENAPRDFIDMTLIEMEKTTDANSSFHGQLGVDNLRVTLFDLFVSGMETVSTTMTWAALYMVRYPEVQQKIQEELDHVVGVNRSPLTTDKPNLPYTEAVIMEIQRHSNIVPFGIQHFT